MHVLWSLYSICEKVLIIIDVGAFSPLPRVLFFYAMWGKERAFLRFISEGYEKSVTERDLRQRRTDLIMYRFFFFFLSSGGWGKIKLELTTLPRIFIHVVCRICRGDRNIFG